jgi:hypothetical protein
MIFKNHKFYTHKRMLDSVIEIVNTKEVEGGLRASVRWLTKRGIYMGVDRILIKKEEFSNWYEWSN